MWIPPCSNCVTQVHSHEASCHQTPRQVNKQPGLVFRTALLKPSLTKKSRETPRRTRHRSQEATVPQAAVFPLCTVINHSHTANPSGDAILLGKTHFLIYILLPSAIYWNTPPQSRKVKMNVNWKDDVAQSILHCHTVFQRWTEVLRVWNDLRVSS